MSIGCKEGINEIFKLGEIDAVKLRRTDVLLNIEKICPLLGKLTGLWIYLERSSDSAKEYAKLRAKKASAILIVFILEHLLY